MLYFDRKLKAKLSIKHDELSQQRLKIYKTFISKPVVLVIFIYVVIMPFISPPNWCANYWNSINRFQWTYDCQEAGLVNEEDGVIRPIRVAGVHLSSIIATMADTLLISILTFVRFYKASFMNQSWNAKFRNYILLTLLTISIIDEFGSILVQAINGNYFNLIRPLVAIVFMS